jgi:S1-C subfamily serine protease
MTMTPQNIESPVADGTLGPRGFRLASPKLAGAFGLEAGDVILAVDGRAVNTFDDLYHAYQQVRRAARRPRFEVTLERDGVQVTKTYLIK